MYVAKLMVSYLVKLYLFKITLRLYQNHTPIFTTSLGWFSQNHTPTLPKSHSDFTKIALRFSQTTGWFSQRHWLILHKKSHADFAKITLRRYQNRRLIFTKITDWFSQKRGLVLKPQIVVLLYAVSKPHPPPLCVPACQKVSAVSSRACRVALTVFVLACGKKPSGVYR